MKTVKELFPLKIKSPAAVFLREYGKLPFRLVWDHVRRTYIEEGGKVSPKTKKRIYQSVHTDTLRYLDAQYGHIVSKVTKKYIAGEKPEEQVIWVFWWQGEENAPDIVKRCITSIRRNAHGMQVHVIDSENYQNYVSVPPHITQKRNAGIISFTHFSDYYRMALLAAHGGVWIDASVYLKDELPSDIHNSPLYTVRNPGEDITNVSNWEWSVSIIGGWKGNTLFRSVELLLKKYWKTNDNLVDYFLFDYLIRLVFDQCDKMREDITNIPPSNFDFMYLQNHLCEAAHKYIKEFYAQDTFVYKISWKGTYPVKTPDGSDTVYARWLSENPHSR